MAAITTYGVPVTPMNTKQLRRIARDNGIYFDLSTSRATLITAIED
jgi:hypothetical protein